MSKFSGPQPGVKYPQGASRNNGPKGAEREHKAQLRQDAQDRHEVHEAKKAKEAREAAEAAEAQEREMEKKAPDTNNDPVMEAVKKQTRQRRRTKGGVEAKKDD